MKRLVKSNVPACHGVLLNNCFFTKSASVLHNRTYRLNMKGHGLASYSKRAAPEQIYTLFYGPSSFGINLSTFAQLIKIELDK